MIKFNPAFKASFVQNGRYYFLQDFATPETPAGKKELDKLANIHGKHKLEITDAKVFLGNPNRTFRVTVNNLYTGKQAKIVVNGFNKNPEIAHIAAALNILHKSGDTFWVKDEESCIDIDA